MGRNNSLIDYLPFYEERTGEFEALCQAEQNHIDTLWGENERLLGEGFVTSAESEGLSRLEDMLELSSKGLNIAERRENIVFKLMGDLPYTMNTVYKRLKTLCGESFTFEYGSTAYTLNIRLGIENADQYEVIKSLLYKILPANIEIDLGIKFNTHGYFTAFTHGAMAAYTHKELRETEV
ncbi:MAG: YmfQ family protein [Clostridiales bacterium]|nr:YmfQ family protein [Clostridiales bacterium]